MMDNSKKNLNKLLVVTFILYPFFPLIKEWNLALGTIAEAVLIISLFIDSVLVNKKQSIIIVTKHIFVYYLTFFLIYFVLNISEIKSAFSGIRTFLLYLIIYNEMNKLKNTQFFLNSTIKPCIFVGNIMAIGCIIQFISPDIIKTLHNPNAWKMLRYKTDWKAFGIYNRALSFMTDPNVLSVFLVFVLLIILNYYSKSKKRYLILLSMTNIIGILLTQSRTGIFLTVIFFVVVVAEYLLRNRKSTPFKLILFIVVVCVASFCFLFYMEEILFFLRVDTLLSGNGRLDKNAIHFEELLNNPIRLFVGHGLFDGRSIVFENSYFAMLYMFGILGVLFFLVLGYKYFKDIWIIDNFKYCICYLFAILVGDYVLIPQITLPFLALLFMNKISKVSNNRTFLVKGEKNEDFAGITTTGNGGR